jgi:galactokinase
MTESMLYKEAKSFFQIFEPKGEIITGIKVPGSVQILGDTADFNRGRVISGNIAKSAILMAQKRKEGDRSVQFYSRKYDEKIRMTLNDPQSKEERGWANFMSSTLFMLEGTSRKVNGMNVFIDSLIPDVFDANGMEALEVGIAYLASQFSDWQTKGLDIASVCAEGERKYMGRDKNYVKYIPIIFAKNGMVTYFDAQENKEENIPVKMDGFVFMALSSGLKKKRLEEKRKKVLEEVREAMSIMKKNGAAFENLNNLTMEQFDVYRSRLSMTQRKRCAYFISENERVDAARQALKAGNMAGFAEIINDSQKNIKNRLELVEEENEILLDIIQDSPEIKAARLLNMGMDGTAVALVEKDKRQAVETKIKKTFLTRTGLELSSESFDLNNELEEMKINVSEFKK